jgi:hypothetical protein
MILLVPVRMYSGNWGLYIITPASLLPFGHPNIAKRGQALVTLGDTTLRWWAKGMVAEWDVVAGGKEFLGICPMAELADWLTSVRRLTNQGAEVNGYVACFAKGGLLQVHDISHLNMRQLHII